MKNQIPMFDNLEQDNIVDIPMTKKEAYRLVIHLIEDYVLGSLEPEMYKDQSIMEIKEALNLLGKEFGYTYEF
jgi:hypothetical protein